MKKALLLCVAVLFPSAALADCVAVQSFMSKWKLSQSDMLYDTKKLTSKDPVYVFNMGRKLGSDRQYAIVFQDNASCTIEAEFRDLPGLLYIMETNVYGIWK